MSVAADTVVIHTDGASRGNPGPAAIGVVIAEPSGRVLAEFGEALPNTTNNVAEYTAVIRALERARALGARRVQCLMDSQLVVRQLNGQYRVKHPDMLPLYRRVLELIQEFDEVTFAHVPRELNAEADRLANQALDGGGGGETPERLVSGFFQALVAGEWLQARRVMSDDFRFRRVTKTRELDAAAFLEMWQKTTAGHTWRPGPVRTAGSEVILEAMATHRDQKTAVLWICVVEAGKVQRLVEYEDNGS